MAKRRIHLVAADAEEKIEKWSKEAVQKHYLMIQSAMGEFERGMPLELRPRFRELSAQLVRIKREWIGDYDEVKVE